MTQDRRAREVADAVRNIELSATDAWTDLDPLSSNTTVDVIEAFEDEIRFDQDHFEGPIVVHVTLKYGGRGDEFTLSETFPGTFEGQFKDGKINIIDVDVDTSGFFK